MQVCRQRDQVDLDPSFDLSSGIDTMEHSPERRSCRRVILGPEHTIRFEVKGHIFQNVRITNISLTGCFAMVSQGDTPLFTQGTLLEHFVFEHPDLRLEPILAKVMYLLGGASDAAALEFTGVGIHFVNLDRASTNLLEAFLVLSLKP
jgi:hypothetical protein